MIISDLTYQELAIEADNLEGGFDFGFSTTGYDISQLKFGNVTTSGPNGSTAVSAVDKLDISTFGLTGVGLNLPNAILI